MGARTGACGAAPFPSPLIKPDVPIWGIRLSDWLHHRLTNARASVPAGARRPKSRTPGPQGTRGCLAKTPGGAASGSASLCHRHAGRRPISLRRARAAEVCSPALQLLIQPLTHFRPRFYIARHQQVSHVLLDPGHALLRRTVPDILLIRPHTVVRPECVSQKFESLPTRVPDTRLLLV
jgi:hypothetical protein